MKFGGDLPITAISDLYLVDLGQETPPRQSSGTHPNVTNKPEHRLARKRPGFLLGAKAQGKLLAAVKAGEILPLLKQLDKGVSANVKDGFGTPALQWAAATRSVSIVFVLLERGADVHMLGYKKRTALHWAATSGSEEIVSMLLEKGANVNVVDYGNQSPLLFACLQGHHGVAKALIKSGASVDLSDAAKFSPLHAAASRKRPRIAEALMDAAADVHAVHKSADGGFSWTPLHCAAFSDAPDIVESLLQRGALPMNTGEPQLTSVHFAAMGGSIRSLPILLDAWPAGVNAKDDKEDTPLILAAAYGKLEACKILLKRRADVNSHGDREETALSIAIEQQNLSLLELLAENGADLDARIIGLTYEELARKQQEQVLILSKLHDMRQRGATEGQLETRVVLRMNETTNPFQKRR